MLHSEYQGSFELAIGHSTSNYDGGSISMKAGDTIGEVGISVDSLYTHALFHILCNLIILNLFCAGSQRRFCSHVVW